MVIVTAVYATILFWERWTDVPQLEIQTKDIKISKEEDFYSIKVPVLNSGRRGAIGWRGHIQIFNRKCGNKVHDGEMNKDIPLSYGTDEWRHMSSPVTKVSDPVYDGKIEPADTAYFSVKLPSLEGDFVAVIRVVTHNSNDNKIIRYPIYPTSTYIEPKYGTWLTCVFVLESLFLRKYVTTHLRSRME